MDMRPVARVIGNAGMYFIAPYAGSTLAMGYPQLETASFTALVGLILSTSRELIAYGKSKEM